MELADSGITMETLKVSGVPIFRLYFKDFRYTLMFIILVVLTCEISIIKSSRMIGICKSEGHSRLSVFKLLLFDRKTPYLVITLLLFNLLFFMYLNKFGYIANSWLLSSMIPTMVILLLSLLILFGFVSRIYNQATSQLIKNKMKWKSMVNFITVGKIIILVPLILVSLSMYELVDDALIYSQRLKSLERINKDFYYIKYTNGSYEMDYLEQYDSLLLEKLEANIVISSSVITIEDTDGSLIFYVSDEFFVENNIDSNFETVYISENTSLREDDIIRIASEYSPQITGVYYIDETMFDLLYLNNYSYIKNGENVMYMLNIPNFNSIIFSYDGNLEDAQNYINDMTKSLNIGSPFYIGSFMEEVVFLLNSKIGEMKSQFMYLISLMILLFLFTITIISAQREVHAKEDKVRLSEGYIISKSMKVYLLFDSLSRFAMTLFFSVFLNMKLHNILTILIIH